VYLEGQFVWLHDTQRRPKLSKKLALPWKGPYLVVKALSSVTYRIQRTRKGKTKVVHADRLKLYEGPALVSWRYKGPSVMREEGPEVHTVEDVDQPQGTGGDSEPKDAQTAANSAGPREGTDEGVAPGGAEAREGEGQREARSNPQQKSGEKRKDAPGVRFDPRVEICYIDSGKRDTISISESDKEEERPRGDQRDGRWKSVIKMQEERGKHYGPEGPYKKPGEVSGTETTKDDQTITGFRRNPARERRRPLRYR
jgi:hypothetical protein